MVGDRLYLRAFTPEDAELASRQLRDETEISFPEGRDLLNPYVLGARASARKHQQPLPRKLHFAIVIGETGEMIGANALFIPIPSSE